MSDRQVRGAPRRWGVAWPPVAVLACLGGSALAAAAPPMDHEALVARIEARYVSAMVVSADSPLVKAILAPGLAANPGVDPQTWESVKADTASAIVRLFTSKGGSLDVLVRGALEPFTDKDLQALDKVLGNPTFRRFQAAMSSPAAQQQLLSGMAKDGLNLSGVVNGVLESHQLHGAH